MPFQKFPIVKIKSGSFFASIENLVSQKEKKNTIDVLTSKVRKSMVFSKLCFTAVLDFQAISRNWAFD